MNRSWGTESQKVHDPVAEGEKSPCNHLPSSRVESRGQIDRCNVARHRDHRGEEVDPKRIPLLAQIERGSGLVRKLIGARNVDDLERMSNVIDTYPSISSGDPRELCLRDSSLEVASRCLPCQQQGS